MPKVYVGVTDRDWYVHLGRLRDRLESAGERLDELNFWQPGGSRVFRSLREGELFLFKLHSPNNFIVGGGIFACANLLPSTLAWQSFGQKNGAATFDEMQRRILKYRRAGDPRESFTIGCILLQSPFFLDRSRWLPMPDGFPLNAVQGKTYDTTAPEMQPILAGLANVHVPPPGTPSAAEPLELDGPNVSVWPADSHPPTPGHRNLSRDDHRSLRSTLRRCAVTGERTLPVLEAAHIRPVAAGGRHATDNGLLLRSDVHRLFDAGYVTVTPQHRFLVSGRIKKEFDNGREYYALNDTQIRLPRDPAAVPRKDFLQWHADARFLG